MIEYCLLSVVLILAIMGAWKKFQTNAPGMLVEAQEKAIKCMADATAVCK